jgi:hypothetical protein
MLLKTCQVKNETHYTVAVDQFLKLQSLSYSFHPLVLRYLLRQILQFSELWHFIFVTSR